MSQGSVSERITTGINKLLSDGHRVVWWSDPEAEFLDAVDDLAVEGAELIAVADNPALAIKRRIELDDDPMPVVLYESRNAPEPEQDWLLDIRLYAAPFAADATSMLQQDLGLRSATLREHLKSRAFFCQQAADREIGCENPAGRRCPRYRRQNLGGACPQSVGGCLYAAAGSVL